MKVLIEVPKGSKVKYEIDKETNLIEAHRIVQLPYPDNYGFIPDTLADDGDPLDVFVLSEYAIAPMSLVEVVVIGMVKMVDNGEVDNKLLAVMLREDELSHVELRIKAIRNFLTIYKDNVTLGDTCGLEVAKEYLKRCRDVYYKGMWDPSK